MNHIKTGPTYNPKLRSVYRIEDLLKIDQKVLEKNYYSSKNVFLALNH